MKPVLMLMGYSGPYVEKEHLEAAPPSGVALKEEESGFEHICGYCGRKFSSKHRIRKHCSKKCSSLMRWRGKK